jgi:hypothetical protein
MFNFAKYMIASGMILLLISHGIIQFGMFELVQTNLRSESTERINRGIPQHQQVIFRFGVEDYRDKSSQINWKDKDEFRLDGKMYDIIKKETSGDSVYLYCIIDREESDLYSILDKLIEDDSENSDKENRINNYFSHFYSYSPQNNFHKIYQSENRYFGRIVISLLEGDLSLGTPPPRA